MLALPQHRHSVRCLCRITGSMKRSCCSVQLQAIQLENRFRSIVSVMPMLYMVVKHAWLIPVYVNGSDVFQKARSLESSDCAHGSGEIESGDGVHEYGCIERDETKGCTAEQQWEDYIPQNCCRKSEGSEFISRLGN